MDLVAVGGNALGSVVFHSCEGGLEGLLGGDGSLLEDNSVLLGNLLDGSLGLLSAFLEDLGVGVELGHLLGILQWVGLLLVVSSGGHLLVLEDLLDDVGVDQLGEIGVGHNLVLELVALLEGSTTLSGSEVGLEGRESGLGPDAESSEVTTGSNLSDVKSVDVDDVGSGDVSEGLSEGITSVVNNDQWSSSGLVSSVSELTVTGSHLLGTGNSLEVGIGSASLEHSKGLLGSGNLGDGVVEDQWELGDTHHSVTSGHDEGGTGGGGNGGGKGMSSLVDIDLSVPPSPGVQWMGHSSLSTHVTESTLTGSVGTGTGNSWNSGNGSTGSPGLSRVLHTGLGIDSVGLSDIFAQLIVNI